MECTKAQPHVNFHGNVVAKHDRNRAWDVQKVLWSFFFFYCSSLCLANLPVIFVSSLFFPVLVEFTSAQADMAIDLLAGVGFGT
jgi:hypothetical protein